jgi:hypothetical protein
LAYPPQQKKTYQQLAVCFHALAATRDAQPDHEETTDAAWFDPEHTEQLTTHPAMRQRLTNALAEPHRAHEHPRGGAFAQVAAPIECCRPQSASFPTVHPEVTSCFGCNAVEGIP